jgi:hypothetical protein
MLKNLSRIELTRIIRTGVTEKYLKELLETTLSKYRERISWLENNNYTFHILAEVESGGLVENTSWPAFDHAVIYLEIDKETAIHYKLVWD